jgi:hypothetical protein
MSLFIKREGFFEYSTDFSKKRWILFVLIGSFLFWIAKQHPSWLNNNCPYSKTEASATSKSK